MYNLVYHQTKYSVGKPGTPKKTPTKIKIHTDDELHQTETHSSTQKMAQPKTCELHLRQDVEASSQHEESELQDKMENITIFGADEDFGKKEPQVVGRGP